MKTKITKVIDNLMWILLFATIGSLIMFITYSVQANGLAAGTMDMYAFLEWIALENDVITYKGITIDLAVATLGLWVVGSILRIED